MFDLSVVSLLLRAVPCREVGSVGEKTGGWGAMCGEKKCSCSGAERTEADIVELVPRFCSFLPLFRAKVPFFCVFPPFVFWGLRRRACQLRGKERRFEGVGCKLIRTSEEKKRKPRLETGLGTGH